MSDLISRQQAIDYIKMQRGRPFIGITLEEAIIMMIEEVPSAEPKTPSNGSITCMKPKKMHDRTTGDLISREDACEAVKNEMESWLEGDRCDYRNVVDAIMDLPSAEKAQLSGEDATKDATSDLISKKEATTIPVMPKEHREYQTMNLDDAYEQGWFDYQKCIEELPSAEPERHLNCKNCIHLGHAYMMPCKNCKRNQMLPDWYEERREE